MEAQFLPTAIDIGGHVVALEVKDFWKSYRSFQAVKGVDFTVKENEIFGLIGPNGTGKTSTRREVATLLQITWRAGGRVCPSSGAGDRTVFCLDV
ncbi:MAG: ATP-binding cassette domain-containing protein [Methanomassiliicoccales archaeon]